MRLERIHLYTISKQSGTECEVMAWMLEVHQALAIRVVAVCASSIAMYRINEPAWGSGDEGCNPGFRGLHLSTFQLNLSRVCHKKTPYTP